MRTRASIAATLTAVTLTVGLPGTLSGQVVEARESEANPASVLFRSTLYGAGTGLVLTGAYALIDDDDVGERLRWGTAIGAGAGLLVGLVYLASRSDAEEEGQGAGAPRDGGLLRVEDGALSVSVPGIASRVQNLPGPDPRMLDVDVVVIEVR